MKKQNQHKTIMEVLFFKKLPYIYWIPGVYIGMLSAEFAASLLGSSAHIKGESIVGSIAYLLTIYVINGLFCYFLLKKFTFHTFEKREQLICLLWNMHVPVVLGILYGISD